MKIVQGTNKISVSDGIADPETSNRQYKFAQKTGAGFNAIEIDTGDGLGLVLRNNGNNWTDNNGILWTVNWPTGCINYPINPL